MPKAETHPLYKKLHGKPNKSDKGYFYVIKDQQFYREREENYQRNQSIKQKYNSAAFAYATALMAENYGTPEAKAALAVEYEDAHHIASNGQPYKTPWSWKFNSYQFDYKQTHPFSEFADTAKQDSYNELMPQIESLLAGEDDMIANMANVAAVLHKAFGFLWTGFYRVEGQQLVLGPFQGPIACTRIPFGRGVCGTAWQQAQTVIVPNVHEFAGHIACSSASNSEIVVPIIRNNQVIAVLDIDSADFNTFDETDQLCLEQIAAML